LEEDGNQMVDFKKRLAKSPREKITNPLAIYDRLDRASDKGPLRPAQIAILESWYKEQRNTKDVILKLNTGQGKTLIGLLMLQSKMNENDSSALYLCPNNMLVSQTITQAKQFGISCVTSDGELPDEFLDGKSIFVTSVQKLFNGLSKFKLGLQSLPVENIVIDDAHACIDSIKDSYTIKLSSDHLAYKEILELFSTDLEEQGAGTYADIRHNDIGAFLPVPYWKWIDRNLDVVRILSKYATNDSVKFAWPLIKDILRDCLCVVSGSELEISPYRPPLHMFGSYDKAKHRIFMSATITDDSFLIKGLGLSEETINNPLIYNNEKWSGEKMILLPSQIHPDLTDIEIVNLFAKTSISRRMGIVVFCPSFNSARIWEAAGAHVATKADIQSRVEMLRNGNFSDTLVVVNRYDGIDLPDDSCRILIMDSKPFSEDLLDRYIEACREGSEVVAVKTARIIEQGLGRSVRGEKDFSVIILTGNDLIRCIKTRDARKYFSAQTRAQIEIGLEVGRLAQEDITDDISPVIILRKLLFQCLNRDEGWKEFYIEKMNQITQSYTTPKILHIFSSEMRAENRYYEGDPDSAVSILQDIIDNYAETLSDKGWYLQEMARYLYTSSKIHSNEKQIAAHNHNRYLLKPKDGMVVKKITVLSQKRIENICNYIKNHGSFDELSLVIDEMTSNLHFGVKADTFEKSLNDLAFALGFEGERPDKEWKNGPDNLWGLRDNEFLLFECKSEVAINRPDINKDETGQMNNSYAWFRNNYIGAKVKCILIIPTKTLSRGAGFNDAVQIMRDHNLKHLTKNVKAFFNEFRNLDITNLSENKIQTFIDAHKLDIHSIVTEYSEEPKSIK
jgi:replicative superfamily II helicase